MSTSCEDLSVLFNSMEVIDFKQLREKIVLSFKSCKSYLEWIQNLEQILENLQPNSKTCEIIMNLAIESQYYSNHFLNFAMRLCTISDEYRRLYEQVFQNMYKRISEEEEIQNHHRVYEEIKFFAILFESDSISWNILSCLELKKNCRSSKEFFVTLLLSEMARSLGHENLSARLMDPNLQRNLPGLFPKDKLEDTLYAIQIFDLVHLQTLIQHLQEYVNRLKDDELTYGVEKMSL